MIIKLYVRPGDDPGKVAREAKAAIEQETGLICNVRVVGQVHKGVEALTWAPGHTPAGINQD